MNKSRGIITGSLVLTMIIGVLNSIYKNDKLPSLRFFFGGGVLYLLLSGLADFEEEIAKTLALGIVTFTVLGEGGGVLDHFLGGGTSKSTLNTEPANPKQLPSRAGVQASGDVLEVPPGTRRETGLPTTVGAYGLSPVKPVIPNGIVIHGL